LRRQDEIGRVVGERARVRPYLCVTGGYVPPPGYRRETDRRRADPDQSDEDDRPADRHSRRVGDWVGDGPVAVQRNDREVEDGRRAGEYV